MGKSTQERLKSRQVADIPIREMQGRELAESMMNGPNEKLFKKHHELWIEIEEDDLESNDQFNSCKNGKRRSRSISSIISSDGDIAFVAKKKQK